MYFCVHFVSSRFRFSIRRHKSRLYFTQFAVIEAVTAAYIAANQSSSLVGLFYKIRAFSLRLKLAIESVNYFRTFSWLAFSLNIKRWPRKFSWLWKAARGYKQLLVADLHLPAQFKWNKRKQMKLLLLRFLVGDFTHIKTGCTKTQHKNSLKSTNKYQNRKRYSEDSWPFNNWRRKLKLSHV